MLGKLRFNPVFTTSQINCADSSAGTLVAAIQKTSDPSLVVIDLATGQRIRTISLASVSTSTHPNFLRFISSTEVAVAYISTIAPQIVNINTGVITQPSGTHGQFRATWNFAAGDCNTQNNYGVYAEDTNRTLTSFTSSTRTKYTTSMTWMGSAVKVYAVCAKPSSNNFIIAQSDGYIREVDPTNLATTPVAEFVLPAATYDGGSVHQPESIRLTSDDVLIVTTQHGALLKYTYSSGTLLETRTMHRAVSSSSSAAGGLSFQTGKIVNNILPMWMTGVNNPTLTLWDIAATPMLCVGSVTFPANDTSTTAQISCAGIDSTSKTVWVAWKTGRMAIFDATRLFASTATTEIFSSGSPVSGKILRFPLHTNNACRLEYSNTISAAEASIATRFSDIDYLEIATTGSGGTEKADARLFHS